MTPSPTPRQPDDIHVLAPGADPTWAGAWPDRCASAIGRAELHHFRTGHTPRAQVLVFAGGGYLQLVHDKEGVQVAQWLNDRGLDAHVLLHRLPGQPDGAGGVWPVDIALRDAVQALQHLQRAQPELPVLLLGLSSGGHLAGTLACQPEAAGVRGVAIAYAPLNANHRDHKAPAGKPDFPPPEKQAFYDAWPIGIATAAHGLPRCPVFLAYALHDPIVPIDHALNLLKAAQQHGLAVDAHVFAQAEHGFALRALNGRHDQWPALLARWIDEQLAP